MRIAIAQMSTRAGNFGATAARMVELSRSAAEQGVDLLVFPAPTLCGVTPVPYADREGYLLDLAECLSGLVEDLECPCLVPVLVGLDDASLPEAVLVSGGSVVPLRLASYVEAASLAQGQGDPDAHLLPEVEHAGARLGVAFTYEDLDEYDEYEYDVDVIVYLPAYGFAVDDPSSALGSSLTEGRFLADAEATGAWIVAAGAVGSYDAQVHCGSSFVLAPWGELAAQAPSLEEALLVCDVDPSAEGPLGDPLTPEVYDGTLMAWGALVRGIADACELVGGSGACLVVDGTLASMVLATLAVDALGPTRVRVLVGATGDAAADAASAQLVSALRLPEGSVMRLDPVPSPGDAALARDLAEVRLAALARDEGLVPLGSEDKTGLALDGSVRASAAQVSPLADLYRSDVVALGHLRNTISPAIPAAAFSSLDVPAVPGLEALSSDEVRLEFVDLVLSSYVEWELPVSDIVAERGRPEAVAAIVGLMRAPAGLLGTPGMVIALTSRTLSEARGPLGLAWSDRVRAEEERARGEAAVDALAHAAAPARGGRPGGGQAPSASDRERDVHDLLGYLRDFSQGGAFSSSGEPGEDAGGRGGDPGTQPLWEGPFSEN